jgi:opacity protein-like surface antigen
MKASKLALALLVAAASTAAFAADGYTQSTESGTKWYEAGKRQLQSDEQNQKLEQEGFQQYAN